MKRLLILCLCVFWLSGCSFVSSFFEEDIVSDQYQYYYETLNSHEKTQYNRIYEAMLNHEKKVIIEDVSKYDMFDLFVFVSDDHPELFWVDRTYSYVELEDEKIQMTLDFNMPKEEIESTKHKIEKVRDTIIASIDKNASDHEKIKAVFDYICEHVSYVDESENEQNIQSVFITNESVCSGYARAFQYILLEMGYECTIIEGTDIDNPNDPVGHVWNMVKIKDDYLYYDVTWADENVDLEHPCHAYFSLTHEEMLKSYVPEKYYEETKNLDNTWFKEAGVYLTKWDETIISELWKEAIEKGNKHIELKCSEDAYELIYDRIANTQDMFPLMEKVGIDVETYYFIQIKSSGIIDVFYQ